MNSLSSRFFIALLPPLEIQDRANHLKQEFADRYASRGAQKSPPHITLHPPFEQSPEQVPVLEQSLTTFASSREQIPVILSGFGASAPPCSIFINALKTQELLSLQVDLTAHLEVSLGIVNPVFQTRPFSPHITVAYRDLTRSYFEEAWPEFLRRSLQFEFTATELTLLLHDGNQWHVSAQFPFLSLK